MRIPYNGQSGVFSSLLSSLPRRLPCALSAELLACFVGSCPRRLARPACRHKRRITAPRAADCQQAIQRVQTSKEAHTLAGGRVAYSIPYLAQLPKVADSSLMVA
jgi:hypothetical protein